MFKIRRLFWQRLVARILLILWFGSWIIGFDFMTTEGVGPRPHTGFNYPLGVIMIIFAILLRIIWKWEVVGGLLMIAFGAFFSVVSFSAIDEELRAEVLVSMILMDLSPLLGGILLLWAHRRELKENSPAFMPENA